MLTLSYFLDCYVNVPFEKSAVQEFIEREERHLKNVEEASHPKQLEREEWMIVPPKSGDLLGRE